MIYSYNKTNEMH